MDILQDQDGTFYKHYSFMLMISFEAIIKISFYTTSLVQYITTYLQDRDAECNWILFDSGLRKLW
jgi:hypothetical protein